MSGRAACSSRPVTLIHLGVLRVRIERPRGFTGDAQPDAERPDWDSVWPGFASGSNTTAPTPTDEVKESWVTQIKDSADWRPTFPIPFTLAITSISLPVQNCCSSTRKPVRPSARAPWWRPSTPSPAWSMWMAALSCHFRVVVFRPYRRPSGYAVDDARPFRDRARRPAILEHVDTRRWVRVLLVLRRRIGPSRTEVASYALTSKRARSSGFRRTLRRATTGLGRGTCRVIRGSWR